MKMKYYVPHSSKDMFYLSICMMIVGFVICFVATMFAYEDIFLMEQWILIPIYICVAGFGLTLIIGFSFIMKLCFYTKEIKNV